MSKKTDMLSVEGRLQYDRKRGVIYFHGCQGEALLRIEGVPEVPEGHQIDIHLVEPGGEHHHGDYDGKGRIEDGSLWDDGAICAVKLGDATKQQVGRTRR